MPPRPKEKFSHAAADAALNPTMVYPLFVAQVIALIPLQKLGLPAGGGKVLALCLPLMLATIAWRFVRYRALEVDARRLGFYLLFCVSALLSQTLGVHNFGIPAITIVLISYLPLVVRIEVDRKMYLKCMNVFQVAMLMTAAVVILEDGIQRVASADKWPDLEKVVPEALLVPGYNYHRELGFKVGRFSPNAIFYLEPSFVSQFIALAIVIELVFYERLLFLGSFAVAMVLLYSGTGMLMLAAAAPFLVARTSPKLLLLGLFAIGMIGFAGMSFGWFDTFLNRIEEVNQPGTSGYARFTEPYLNLLHSVRDTESTLFGDGAGLRVESADVATLDLPVTKLMQEYGLITTVAFFVCFCHALFESAPSGIVAWTIFFCFNFCGASLSIPAYVCMCITLGSLLRIKPEPEHAPGSPRADLAPVRNLITVRPTANFRSQS